ncbi:MAG: hypothetical protein ACOCVF_04165, partial [bacterium]
MAQRKVISKKERQELYTKIKHQLGYPIRTFEIKDEMLDSYLEIAIENYSEYINNWLLEQQWNVLQDLELDNVNLTFALTTKTLDFEKSFSYAYSKQVGLGANGPSEWELKMDYITVSANTQVYNIPAGREVNEVLWYTPPMIDQGIVDPFAITNWGAGTFGWSYLGKPAQYVQPTYSLLLSAQDRSTKRRILDSILTYRITPGPNGTKNLFLYPVPGSENEIGGKWGKHYEGAKIFYWYYPTTHKNRNKCLELNSDIIKLPSDVPFKNLTWDKLNDISKTRIRKLLLAETKKAIGKVRGFFSGDIEIGNISKTMDYRMLLDEGEREEENVYSELKESLEKITLKNIMADKAEIAENLNRVLQYNV